MKNPDIAPDAPTPETDAEVIRRNYGYDRIPADFARTLERQRNALQAQIDSAKAELPPRTAAFAAFCGRTRIVIDEEDYLRERKSAALAIAKERQRAEVAKAETQVVCKAHKALGDSLIRYRERAESAERQLVANEKVREYEAAAPLCAEHKPNGGTRSNCLVCSCIKLSAALSRIDYLCGEPNVQQVSGYDLHCDEDEVVAAVTRLNERMRALSEDRERIDWLQDNLVVIRDIGWIEKHDLRAAIDAARGEPT